MPEIRPHSDAASLLADPDTIGAALELLRALERLEVVCVVNGREHRGAIRFSENNAIVEVVIDTDEE